MANLFTTIKDAARPKDLLWVAAILLLAALKPELLAAVAAMLSALVLSLVVVLMLTHGPWATAGEG